MTGEEALHALLVAIEENSSKNNGRDRHLLKPLELVVRKTLGLKEENNTAPPPIQHQPASRIGNSSIYPHWRVKYDASGNELGRRRVNSLEEWSQLSKTEPGFHYVLPIDEGSN
jgi:hypothetical protein